MKKKTSEAYWPLIKPGGIMAEHDFTSAEEVKELTGQDWSICRDRTRRAGAVKGAVEEAAAAFCDIDRSYGAVPEK